MRIRISAIGKSRTGPEQELYASYARRLPWKLDCKEFEVKAEGPSRRLREGEKLLEACAGHEAIVALDEGGKTLSSREFAETLKEWQLRGISSAAFVIGGADGLSEPVLRKATLRWSLGRVTWPHILVRALLAEQLYRAHTLISGHPYHRD